MNARSLLAGVLLSLLLCDRALAEGAPRPPGTPPPKMESYQLVLLRRGPAWTPQETAETQRLQREHLAHLQRLGASGQLLVAGPFDDQPDPGLRGLCLYRAGSLAEARRLAESDPAVRAGRLRVEVMTWWAEKGALSFPLAGSGRDAPGAAAAEEAPVRQVTGLQARELLKKHGLLVDVRSPEEFAEGHLPGAVNLPLPDLMKQLAQIPKEHPVVVYCRAGQRSEAAARKLGAAGFEVYSLGAMDNWGRPPAR